MLSRTDEIKNIMRQLRDSNVKNESATHPVNEDTETENDASEADLVLARFEKVIAAATGEDEEEPAEDEDNAGEDEAPAEDEDNADEAPAEDEDNADEDEEPAEESYRASLEDRIAALERRFTESRRRQLCKRFTR